MYVDRPSKNLITTLPSTASQTTTSAMWVVRSLPSTLPSKWRSVSSSSSVARWMRASPLPFSSPIDRSATRGSATPSTRSAKIAPIRAYWTRFSGVESGLAPMSRRTTGPFAVIIWTASAGRSTPGSRPRRRTAAAIPAPVCPAVTTASAWPFLTRSTATRIDESFFSRSASAGCSSMPTTWLDMDDRGVRGKLAGDAADDRLVADEDHPVVGICPGVVERPEDDLGGTVIAAHRVDRDADPVALGAGRLGRGLGHRVSARRRRPGFASWAGPRGGPGSSRSSDRRDAAASSRGSASTPRASGR